MAFVTSLTIRNEEIYPRHLNQSETYTVYGLTANRISTTNLTATNFHVTTLSALSLTSTSINLPGLIQATATGTTLVATYTAPVRIGRHRLWDDTTNNVLRSNTADPSSISDGKRVMMADESSGPSF